VSLKVVQLQRNEVTFRIKLNSIICCRHVDRVVAEPEHRRRRVVVPGGGDERHGAQRQQRLPAVLRATRNLHRAHSLRHHLHRGRAGQRHPGAHLRPPPPHAQRAQHVHFLAGARRPAAHPHLRPLHLDRLHDRIVALRRVYLQAVRVCQGPLHRRLGFHPHSTQRR
jgi:hypothetical protein